jgi:hypothetical protein
MATIKLGAWITNIAGSIGGTTFRRNQNKIVVSNKTRGASRNRLLNNFALNALRTIIQAWSLLPQATRDAWATQAAIFQFPDKFGDLKNLNSRELYIKLTGHLLVVRETTPNPNTLSSVVFTSPILDFVIDLPATAEMNFTIPTPGMWALIQIEFLSTDAVSPTFTRRKIIAFSDNPPNQTIDFGDELFEFFPFLQVGDRIRAYVTFMNTDGFRGVPQTVTTTVID